MPSTGLFAIFAGTVVITTAAVLQTRVQRVPNAFALGSLALAWAVALSMTVTGAAPGGLASSIGGALVGGMMLLPLYFIGGLGAGCVKAQMSFGAWIGCAMGFSPSVQTVAIATLAGIVMLRGLYSAVVRLYPSVEYDLSTWQMNAQSPLSLGSIAGLIGCLWYGVV